MTKSVCNNNTIVRIAMQLRNGYPIILKLLFEFLYVNEFSVRYAYLGAYAKLNYVKYPFTWLALIFILLLRRLIRNESLKSVFNLFLYLSIIPSLSIYWLKDESTAAFLLIILFWTVWIFASFIRLFNYKSVSTNSNKVIPSSSDPLIALLFVGVLLSTLYFSVVYGGGRLFVSFDNVYEYRLQSDNQMSSLFAYLFAWNTNLFLPLLLILHLKRSNYIMFGIDVILTLMSYAIYGNKSIFITILLVVGMGILSKLKAEKYTDDFIALFLVLIQSLMIVVPSGTGIALIDRLLEGPAAGHYNYFDFFFNNKLLYLRESIFRVFAKSPYSDTISRIIGSSDKYYSGVYNNMNNGLFSDAYANFGIIGVIIFPIMTVVILRKYLDYMDEFTEGISFTLIILSAMYLISTSLFSWLMTGGVIPSLMLFYYLKKKYKIKKLNDLN